MSEWQTIETAPKDGTQVLLAGGIIDSVWYDENAAKPKCVVGWFSHVEYETEIWVFCSYDSGTYGEYEEPAYWMPLPPLPSPPSHT